MGFVWILKDSYILRVPRNFLKSKSAYLKELLSCSLCLGFWVGFLVSIYSFTILRDESINTFIFPFASSAFCWFLDSCLDLIQEGIVFFKNKRENLE